MSKVNSVRVLGYEYTVKRSPPIDIGGMDQAGRAMILRQLMFVDPTQSKQSQDSTILHEAIEAMNYHLAFDMPHDVIMGMESGMYQFIKDNPKFIRGIIDK
jgi:hypothetical protein